MHSRQAVYYELAPAMLFKAGQVWQRTEEAEAGGLLQASVIEPSLHSEFQTSRGYITMDYLKQTKNKALSVFCWVEHFKILFFFRPV